jgi:hypothetical protein
MIAQKFKFIKHIFGKKQTVFSPYKSRKKHQAILWYRLKGKPAPRKTITASNKLGNHSSCAQAFRACQVPDLAGK